MIFNMFRPTQIWRLVNQSINQLYSDFSVLSSETLSVCFPHNFDFDFDFVLQQHLLCGVSGWRGERAGRLSQPADS